MSFLGTRNAVAIGVSQHLTLGGPDLLSKLSPSLILQFAGAQTMDPRITFTRSTTATFTGSNGLIQTAAINAPRFGYDPVTLAPLGLLIEEQRTNLMLYSEMFSDAVWTKTNSSITANTIASPDGTLTADKLVENTATSTHVILQTVAVTSGTSYSFSIYAKAAERSRILVAASAIAFTANQAIFDLSNGTTSSVVACTASITPVGGGWYRCSWTATATASASPTFNVFLDNGVGPTYTGDGTSGVYIWGADLEAGAFPTSYIPTVASQVTRANDIALMNGTNFSSWYNAAEGTFYAEYARYANILGRILSINNNTNNNQIRINASVSTAIRPDWQIIDGGVTQANVGANTMVAPNVFAKTAGAYAVNSFNQATNSVLGTEDTSGTVPSVSQMNIGATEGNAANINGYIKKIVYYPRRLSNAALQGITS